VQVSLFERRVSTCIYSGRERKRVIFLAIGGHENFYRDLKKYLREREK